MRSMHLEIAVHENSKPVVSLAVRWPQRLRKLEVTCRRRFALLKVRLDVRAPVGYFAAVYAERALLHGPIELRPPLLIVQAQREIVRVVVEILPGVDMEVTGDVRSLVRTEAELGDVALGLLAR